jgi:hypothetical protein
MAGGFCDCCGGAIQCKLCPEDDAPDMEVVRLARYAVDSCLHSEVSRLLRIVADAHHRGHPLAWVRVRVVSMRRRAVEELEHGMTVLEFATRVSEARVREMEARLGEESDRLRYAMGMRTAAERATSRNGDADDDGILRPFYGKDR